MTNNSVDISCIICTHNRESYLRKALASLATQTLDRRRFEVLVVDNHSTDSTKDTVSGFIGNIPNLRYLFEPHLGLSFARNTGFSAAAGQYVAYLDDDAVASPEWLQAIVECFSNSTDRPGMLGGRVDPIWEAPRPDWLPDELIPYLAVVDLGSKARPVTATEQLVGANMAFPTDALKQVGGFPLELGRIGNNLLSNEEILLRKQLEEIGYAAYYDPTMRVQHHVSARRLTMQWFRERAYWQGRSDIIESLLANDPSRWVILGAAIGESYRLARTLAAFFIAHAKRLPAAKLFAAECRLSHRFGCFTGQIKDGVLMRGVTRKGD